MRKGNEVIGSPIYADDTGKELEYKIEEMIFDGKNLMVAGFITAQVTQCADVLFVPFDQIKVFGSDAVIVVSREALIPQKFDGRFRHETIKGGQVLNTQGEHLGTVIDIYFDEQTGAVQGYEISPELVFDAKRKRFFLTAYEVAKVLERTIFIHSQTTVSDRQSQALAVKPDRLLGKVVKQTVYTEGGTPLIIQGQRITPALIATAQRWQVFNQLCNCVDDHRQLPSQKRMAEAIGKKVNHTVKSEDDQTIAMLGQTVDAKIVQKAQTYACSKALLNAVGLSTVDSTVQPPEQKHKKTQTNNNRNQEAQLIRNILGHPVKKTVCDRQNKVILNIGDLITYQAVEQAKQAGVLEVLFDSVYHENF